MCRRALLALLLSLVLAPGPLRARASLTLPGGSRLVARAGALRFLSAGATGWTTTMPGARVEALELVDLDRDGRLEVVATWREGGAAARLQVQVLRPSNAGPTCIFELGSPAVEGELELAGDAASGHTSLVLRDAMPGSGWRRPYLARSRTYYLSKGRVRLLDEHLEDPATPDQLLTAARHYASVGQHARARTCAEALLGASRPGSRGAAAANRLLATLP